MVTVADPVAAVRHFNRFYTRQIGLLDEGLHESPFSLTEVRVMYEIFHRPGVTATEVGEALALDAGYLSRILRGLRRQGLVAARAPAVDRRRRSLSLTERGLRTFGGLNARSSEEVGAMLARLSRPQRRELVHAMRGIEGLLGAPAAGPDEVVLREPLPGELGWVVKRHGEIYSVEYGWSAEFEGLVAGIVGQFATSFDSRLERCWIAELRGEPAGCVFLVKDTPKVAKLRLLLVEPWARGVGVGARLVDACLTFARDAGYLTVRLWTNAELHAARHLYERAGFRMVEETRTHRFGKDQVFQTWELDLR
ncbi:MAG TPA: helix-turn-helix domain-containing GNAT family N-acetyltransferase [Gemmatimonadales bacterium]|nr:helix-turn-helix domain-containing GNAT family N-acetyltransferase [Gemmatimonadales bacterium]